MSLLVIGSAAFDTITTPHGSVEEVLGGSAVYTAVAASYLTPVIMVAVVGEDFGEEALQLLRDRGIDVSAVEVSRGRTFRWACRYSEDLSERKTLRTELNVFDSFRPKLGRKDVGAPYLFLASIDPGIQRAALTRVRPGVAACDTMDFWIDTKSGDLKRLLGAVDGLVINDAEARLLAGELNSVAAARRLLGRGLRVRGGKRGE
jgi:sugar/nucleoside kinase (ribokinase family)